MAQWVRVSCDSVSPFLQVSHGPVGVGIPRLCVPLLSGLRQPCGCGFPENFLSPFLRVSCGPWVRVSHDSVSPFLGVSHGPMGVCKTRPFSVGVLLPHMDAAGCRDHGPQGRAPAGPRAVRSPDWVPKVRCACGPHVRRRVQNHFQMRPLPSNLHTHGQQRPQPGASAVSTVPSAWGPMWKPLQETPRLGPSPTCLLTGAPALSPTSQ